MINQKKETAAKTRLPSKSFIGDYNFGRIAEDYVSQQLKELFCKEPGRPTKEQRKGWDLSLSLNFEVKSDRLTKKTNNVAVEVAYKGEPSGLATTEADIWIWNIEDSYFWVHTGDLETLIMYGDYQTVMGGDGDQSKLVLIPFFDFMTFLAKRI